MADTFNAINRFLFYAKRLKATLDYLAKEKRLESDPDRRGEPNW